ncbi:MAG: aminotransferase class V-fold PLP-dependent enzyme [Actinomycetota bacterium]
MTAAGFDPAEFRSLFPALKNFVYLNTPTAPPGSLPVLDALRRAETTWEEGAFTWRGWEDEAQDTRPLFGKLIGAAPESVALLTSLSEAAATVALSLSGTGRVVVAEHEFRSNLWPWLTLRERGFEVVRIPTVDGVVSTDAYVEAVTPGTRLVAISAVQSFNGYRVDLAPIAERAREVDARLFLNLTQMLGALTFDVEEIRPDYVAAHGYKWMLCPRGAAWLYVRPDRLESMTPLAPNWKSAADPHASYYGGDLDLSRSASRLDSSLPWFSWVGAKAALQLLLSLDRRAVEQRCLELAAAFRGGASERGFVCVPEEHPSHIVGLEIDDPAALHERLERRNVVASVRGGGLRLGFHAFNDESDVEAGLDALGREAGELGETV